MVPAITCTHAGNEYVKKAGALHCIPLGYPRVYRGHILHCFNYSEQTGICPVWNVCPVAGSKTHGCPQFTHLTRKHTHTHTLCFGCQLGVSNKTCVLICMRKRECVFVITLLRTHHLFLPTCILRTHIPATMNTLLSTTSKGNGLYITASSAMYGGLPRA